MRLFARVDAYRVDLADAKAASLFAEGVLADPKATDASERVAISTALLMAWAAGS